MDFVKSPQPLSKWQQKSRWCLFPLPGRCLWARSAAGSKDSPAITPCCRALFASHPCDPGKRRKGKLTISLCIFTQASEHGTQLHAEGKTEHGCHKTKHYLFLTCDFIFFSSFPRRNKLTPCNLAVDCSLHGCLDFRDFLWVGRGRKGRGDSAPQCDGLREEQFIPRYRLSPPSFPQLTLPIAASLYLSTLSKVPPT